MSGMLWNLYGWYDGDWRELTQTVLEQPTYEILPIDIEKKLQNFKM